MNSQNLYPVEPSVAREIFISGNAKYIVFSHSNDTSVGGDNISAIDLFERLAI